MRSLTPVQMLTISANLDRAKFLYIKNDELWFAFPQADVELYKVVDYIRDEVQQ
jgi:hypothetical protein